MKVFATAHTLVGVVALATLGAGCSSSDSPTSPQPAHVQFDRMEIVSAGGTNWVACIVSNVGQSTAYDVRVFWHAVGSDSAQESSVQPRNLLGGRSGFAVTMPADNVRWTWPTHADSIHWVGDTLIVVPRRNSARSGTL